MADRRSRRPAGLSVVRVTAGRDRRMVARLLAESLPRPVTTVVAARGRVPYGVPPRSRLYEVYRRLEIGGRLLKLDERPVLARFMRERRRLDRRAMLLEQVSPRLRRCVRRRERREVMYALGVAGGRGSVYNRRMRGARHTAFSQVRC